MSEYFIGLDIGTESVGWAVTDTQYNIQKRHGKALWGVRVFPEAQKAEERRGFRAARRRYERRNQRIDLLRQLFSEEIAKVDPAFFQRLDESKFTDEDKKTSASGLPLGRYTLFADKTYSDINYHKDFPTIYHLRNALLTKDCAFDVRLVYLAVHHILKNRGHFLFADMNLDAINFELCFDELKDILLNEYDISFDLKDQIAFIDALKDRAMNTTQKKKALKLHSGVSKDDEQLSAIVDLLAGATVKASKICAIELDKETDVPFSLKNDFEAVEPKLLESVGESIRLISAVKRVYDWSVLENLLVGNSTISAAKVKVYEQHKKDLLELKSLFRADPILRKEMFRTEDEKIKNYAAYSRHTKTAYSCSYSDFASYTKKKISQLLPKLDESGTKKASSILEKLDSGIFLQKQTSKDNGIIPHQLHEQELSLILSRAESYLPFLKSKDASGLTVSERILAIFRFRVPYYVGPLNPASPFSWIVRSDEKITPWNFESVVNLPATRKGFIERMTATCSYLGEKVLPKDSLLYSKFVTLNIINKIKINGNELPIPVKQSLFTDLIAQNGGATASSIKSFLLANGYMQKSDEFSGIDSAFKVSLPGYKVFRRILERPNSYDMVEDIIKHIVLFGEDRKLLERWMSEEYGHDLSVDDIAYIMRNRNRFSGWGNLSKEFLSGIEHFDETTGEVFTIIDMLWHSNHNLMELLSSSFQYAEKITAYREEKLADKKSTLNDYLKDSYASPGIRRSIHQTIAIISEIEKIMGAEPKRVFVEVTREEGEKERTVSRKKQLDELYAACKKEEPDVFKELGHFDDPALRSTKLYLYFTQLGRCMYSDEPIDLDRLAIDYDIDHIYPQRVIKDDSITNRVLVKRQLNAEKSDHYPLSDAIRTRMLERWQLLKRKGLIPEEKYRRLTRNTPFQDNELSGFIARQLVETSQACKIVAELLKNRYNGNDRVVYVKAGNVSSFRQDQRILSDGTQKQASYCKNIDTKQDPVFVKCRDVNDFHHAKDAYLNIVVGNVYHLKFTRNPISFIKSGQTYSLNRMFDYEVVRAGECAWIPGNEGSIATVRKTMKKNNILFTRLSYEAKGRLFKQTILKKGVGEAPIKTSDPRMTIDKFGGYTSRTGAYFILVEHTQKKKRIRSLETVLLIDKARFEQDAEGYLTNVLGLENPKLLIKKIPIDSLFSFNGFRMHVSGRTGDRLVFKNANQLVVSYETMQYIKQIVKYLDRCRNAGTDVNITAYDGITAEENEMLYRLLLEKLQTKPYSAKYETPAKTLSENYENFLSLSIANQCRILKQILNMFNSSAASADLKLLCGKMGIGILYSSKNLSNYSNDRLSFIHQSVTGVYEKEIDLLGDSF